MKTKLFILGILFVAAGLRADAGAQPCPPAEGNDQPQLFLNGDGIIGDRTEPIDEAGHAIASLGAGLEYVPAYLPHLGLDVDYDNLAESRNSNERDNNLELSLRLFTPNCGSLFGWLQGGVGYNATPNVTNGRFLAFVEPGLRWFIAPRLAFDAGIQYMSQTPQKAFVQSFGVDLGLSIPLDASFFPRHAKVASVSESDSETGPTSTGALSSTPGVTPVSTPVAPPSPIAMAVSAFSRIYRYRVRKGEDLWTIAGKTIGDPALWPLLSTSKGKPVANPDSIYIGEQLQYHGAYTVLEIAKAVQKAAIYQPSK